MKNLFALVQMKLHTFSCVQKYIIIKQCFSQVHLTVDEHQTSSLLHRPTVQYSTYVTRIEVIGRGDAPSRPAGLGVAGFTAVLVTKHANTIHRRRLKHAEKRIEADEQY